MLNFKAPNKFQKVLRRKYRDFILTGPAFGINGATFGIDRKYADSFKSTDAEVVRYFSEMVGHFLNTCEGFQVPLILKNVYLLTDSEISTCLVKYRAKSGNFWNLLFLEPSVSCDCSSSEQCFYFKLVHELFHAWTGLKYRSLEDEEIFTELVSTVALKRTAQIRGEEKSIRDIVSNPQCSYIARSNKHQGKYQSMMLDPEETLRQILKNTSGGTVHVS
jgi:hypothetical protein